MAHWCHHGCNYAATDMFDRSDSCLECIGLPAEKSSVHTALQEGFAVLTVSSTDRFTCNLWLPAVWLACCAPLVQARKANRQQAFRLLLIRNPFDMQGHCALRHFDNQRSCLTTVRTSGAESARWTIATPTRLALGVGRDSSSTSEGLVASAHAQQKQQPCPDAGLT